MRRETQAERAEPRESEGEATFALHCRLHELRPEREYRFHPERRWRIDFAWPEKKIAVEIEGGVWQGGRHVRGSGYSKDLDKYNALALMGYRVLRFTTRMVKDGTAINTVREAL